MGEFLNFGQALELLKAGRKVARDGWNGEGMWLYVAYPDYGDGRNSVSIMFNHTFAGVGEYLDNFIVMKTECDTLVPWSASQIDILAEDWREVL